MHQPEEEEEDDDDEFLSDDAEVCHSKDKSKQKGLLLNTHQDNSKDLKVYSCDLFSLVVFNPAEVGEEGKGYIWKASLDDTEDEELSHCLWGRFVIGLVNIQFLLWDSHSVLTCLFFVCQVWC